MFSEQRFSGSILASSINLKGSISCKGELQIEGRINGNITGEKVILGSESHMEGSLSADEIIISGKFKGKIKGKSIRLDSGAFVDAEITYEILAIEDGSTVNGAFKKILSAPAAKTKTLDTTSKKEDHATLSAADKQA